MRPNNGMGHYRRKSNHARLVHRSPPVGRCLKGSTNTDTQTEKTKPSSNLCFHFLLVLLSACRSYSLVFPRQEETANLTKFLKHFVSSPRISPFSFLISHRIFLFDIVTWSSSRITYTEARVSLLIKTIGCEKLEE